MKRSQMFKRGTVGSPLAPVNNFAQMADYLSNKEFAKRSHNYRKDFTWTWLGSKFLKLFKPRSLKNPGLPWGGPRNSIFG